MWGEILGTIFQYESLGVGEVKGNFPSRRGNFSTEGKMQGEISALWKSGVGEDNPVEVSYKQKRAE